MDTRKNGTDGVSTRRKPGWLGRRIAIGIYIAMISFIAVVGFYSVIKQVFWPPPGSPPPAETCEGSIADMKERLIAWSADRVAIADGSHVADALFLHNWDTQERGLSSQCTSDTERASQAALRRMRHQVETALTRFERHVDPLYQSLPSTEEGSAP